MKLNLLLSVFLLFPCCVWAQESKTANDSLSLKYNLAATGLIQTGNVDRTLLPLFSNFSLSKKKFEVRQTLNYSWGEIGTPAGKRKVEDEFLAISEFAIQQKRRFFPFAWAMYESSNLRAITNRYLFGSGVGVTIIQNHKDHSLSLRSGLAYEKTRFEILDAKSGWLYSLRLVGSHRILENHIIIQHQTFFQQGLDSPNDYRYRTIWRISVPVWKHIAFSTTLDQSYESAVDTGKKENNFFVSYGITIAN